MSRIGALTNSPTQTEQFVVQLNLPAEVSKVRCEICKDNVNWTNFSSFNPENRFPMIYLPKNKAWTFKAIGLDKDETPVCQATRGIQELMLNTILVFS
ncbi:hypothetical protein [Simkania sp.]|uniref:hypothetical protein n=1 Tax=Simkania sp. TaxID=34094 RepID=UPI003B529B0B